MLIIQFKGKQILTDCEDRFALDHIGDSRHMTAQGNKNDTERNAADICIQIGFGGS